MYVQFIVFEISTEFLFIFEFNYSLILSRRRVVPAASRRRQVVPAAICPGGELAGGESAAASWRRRVGGGEMSVSVCRYPMLPSEINYQLMMNYNKL